MKLVIARETLLTPLQLIAGVVEKRQTLPILANTLLKLENQHLTLIGTDLEVEMQGTVEVAQLGEAGAITVPARKLMDICRSLPSDAQLELTVTAAKLLISSGRSRFSLATLPAEEFPAVEALPGELEFTVEQSQLRQLIEGTHFAMAQQDVRYYLNGMLWEVADGYLRTVTTDGHRLALCALPVNATGTTQIIVPRKAIMELSRLLSETQDDIHVAISSNQLRLKTAHYTFTTKLIDSRYPDYHKVIPPLGDKILKIERDVLKQALMRVAILANEKQRSVSLELHPGNLRIVTINPEQEQAEEELGIDYQGSQLIISFNVSYLLDALTALPAGTIQLSLSSAESSVRVEGENSSLGNLYVVMPMRL